MGCRFPLTGFRSKVIGTTGKRGITFDRNASFSGVPMKLPCGRCAGCKLEASRQWAMRCLHEKRLHTRNIFITLTYDNDHLPEGGTLVKRDLQLFMKRLRKTRPPSKYDDDGNMIQAGVRFYACGEYGDLNKRPHYHAILFNTEFDDKKRIGANRRGDPYYSSVELSALWGAGYALIGDVTFDSAAYVARYVMKKITGAPAGDHYDVMDSDGIICRRVPEFTIMSRRPGIGAGWYKRYGAETYDHDNVIVNGRTVRPPRYYDNKYELSNPEEMAILKSIRRQKATANWRENLVDRRRVKEQVLLAHMGKLHREV